jgi:hypothetical protein
MREKFAVCHYLDSHSSDIFEERRASRSCLQRISAFSGNVDADSNASGSPIQHMLRVGRFWHRDGRFFDHVPEGAAQHL